MLANANNMIMRNQEKGYFVYKISFPDGQYYFGCTSNLRDRLKNHWFDANRHDSLKGELIKLHCESYIDLYCLTEVHEVKQKKSMFKQERICILLNNLDDNMINSVDEFNPFDL